MAKETFKNPLAQAESFKVNDYDRDRVLNFLENYGDQVTDDAYLDFAKEKGIQVGQPDEKRGYFNEYIKNEDFLKRIHDDKAKYNEWDDYEFAGIDDDYTRSFGPVTKGDQYQSYLKWKKEGK